MKFWKNFVKNESFLCFFLKAVLWKKRKTLCGKFVENLWKTCGRPKDIRQIKNLPDSTNPRGAVDLKAIPGAIGRLKKRNGFKIFPFAFDKRTLVFLSRFVKSNF